ncbi:MAG: glycosyltransferase family 2 protein [Chlorobiaceae bacterium]|nr:glycosyltransferase family 2 protein [Chlorobiaceae bacterium]NTV60851.1 glycosyltransferase family 2 protein [Chlorobiaceae bacterium]
MMLIEFISRAFIVLLSLPAAYLFLSTVAAYFFRKECASENRFLNIGVLISAHNEEDGIGGTIGHVLASDYPANRFEVFVIADNCTDHTARNASAAGAKVFERSDPVHRGKGQALDWFLKNRQDHYRHMDAIAIIDADVVPDKNFLRETSLSLSQPRIDVVQAYNGVSNFEAGWRPALIDAAFNVFNHLRMAGSAVLSGTCVLKGNGMAFRTSLLQSHGWPCHSIVEDMEFTLQLLDEGIDVHYNPDASVRSEMVTSGKNASSQRSRWESGRFMLVGSMGGILLKKFIASGKPRYLYAFAELAVPPLSLLVLLFSIATAGSFVLPDNVWLFPVIGFWVILVFYVFSGQVLRRAPLSTWLYLLTAPFYVAWKIPLYAGMMVKKRSTAWVRTTRESEKNDKNNTLHRH